MILSFYASMKNKFFQKIISPINLSAGMREAFESELALGGNVTVGKWTYVGNNTHVYSNTINDKSFIGKFCCLANDVIILTGGEHGYKIRVSNYPFRTKLLGIKPSTESL